MAVLAEPSANFHSSGMHWIPPESPESGRNLWGTDKTSGSPELAACHASWLSCWSSETVFGEFGFLNHQLLAPCARTAHIRIMDGEEQDKFLQSFNKGVLWALNGQTICDNMGLMFMISQDCVLGKACCNHVRGHFGCFSFVWPSVEVNFRLPSTTPHQWASLPPLHPRLNYAVALKHARHSHFGDFKNLGPVKR